MAVEPPPPSKSDLRAPADTDTSVFPLSSQNSASAPYMVRLSNFASLASMSKLGVNPYPMREASPHSLSPPSSPRSTVGKAQSLKLPLLIVSAEFIRKFWAPRGSRLQRERPREEREPDRQRRQLPHDHSIRGQVRG